MEKKLNQEFQIPQWRATSEEPGATFTVQREAELAENEMILEILRIGNEIEMMRVQKIGEKHVRFWKAATRTTR